jgi:hypothetical protein
MELVSDFSHDVKKIASDMRQHAKKSEKSKDALYLLNTATRLERLAESYRDTAWENSMGEDL